jgi:hypothetical protein
MKRTFLTAVCLCICILFTTINAQNIINVGIGPTWPKDLRDTEKPTAWNATIEYYKLFDNIVGFGVDLDFTWNVFYTTVEVIDTTATPPDTVDRKLDNNRIFMFPISAALLFDPIPKSFIHPVIKGQVGVNMMTKSYEELDTTGQEIKSPKNGFYVGIIGKASVDAVYDLGEHAALFAGFEFQWGKLRHKRKGTVQDYDYFEFYGPCIRMGLSVLY